MQAKDSEVYQATKTREEGMPLSLPGPHIVCRVSQTPLHTQKHVFKTVGGIMPLTVTVETFHILEVSS